MATELLSNPADLFPVLILILQISREDCSGEAPRQETRKRNAARNLKLIMITLHYSQISKLTREKTSCANEIMTELNKQVRKWGLIIRSEPLHRL